MSKKEINNLSDRIVAAINNTTNDYDAREEVIKILKHKERNKKEMDCFCLDCKEYEYIISSYRA